MDPFYLRALVAPALASLFLIMSLLELVVLTPASVGMGIPITTVRTVPFSDCDFVSGRSIVVQLRKDGSIWINETPESAEKLGLTLTEIYENRAEKVIYLFADPDVPFGEFASFYQTVNSSTSDLRIVWITRMLDKELRQCPSGSYCELDWHGHTYIPCAWVNLPPVRVPHHALIPSNWMDGNSPKSNRRFFDSAWRTRPTKLRSG
jgi:biopolymer transport protein ExbD